MATHTVAESLISPAEDSAGDRNRATVEELYEALTGGEKEGVGGTLAADLEYWFHGPPHCQHMMRVLTGGGGGEAGRVGFLFEPRRVTAIEDGRVIAEGWEGAHAYWVHVWTLKDGVITQFREYFNTWLTVRDLRPAGRWEIGHVDSPTVWQSQPRQLPGLSMPGLVLAI
ncbi:wound-induced protein 1 [Malania oleifera]|uniref:wound-induced protein 1 n=1 Tax=Malania oleifera TaxID=397392 RepID=UPI0025AE1253|nr:wound-induced protein 1 [Malania oleifera]